MTLDEAQNLAERFNKQPGLESTIVRIIPNAELDPIVEGDNGWDVLTKVVAITGCDDE